MNISKEGVAITHRFFEAVDMLVAQRKIRGLQTLTSKYDINRWNLITVKQNPDSSVLKPEYIAILIRDYNISAEWIMLGQGEAFRP